MTSADCLLEASDFSYSGLHTSAPEGCVSPSHPPAWRPRTPGAVSLSLTEPVSSLRMEAALLAPCYKSEGFKAPSRRGEALSFTGSKIPSIVPCER